MTLLLIAALFTIFLLIGMPVAYSLMLSSIPVFVLTGTMPTTVAIQKMVTALENFPLLAVPFFILAGNLMNEAGITKRLVRFSRLLTGWLAGGLAQVSIMLSMLMGGISGSAVADASMEARLLGPSMRQQGYAPAFIAAVLGFGSIITATIPPSIGLILFGYINEVSIGRLFIGGLLPGLLLTLILMAATVIVAKNRGYAPDLPKPPRLGELGRSFLESIWALMFPVFLVIGFRFGFFTATEAGVFLVIGFRFGFFTATEAGVFLVLYATAVGALIYRELTFKRIIAAFHATMSDLGMVMLLIMMAAVLGYAMTIERAPQEITAFMTSLTENPVALLLIICAILVVAGMFLEGAANILLVTPIVMPVLVHAGFDPVHMGIVIVLLINFGGLTPPVGVIMFTVCGILDVKTGAYARAAIPFFLAFAMFFVLLLAFPWLSVALPNAIMR